jgi:hypothetical protein
MILQNVGNYLPNDMVQQFRRPESSSTLVWEPQFLQITGASKTKEQCMKTELSQLTTIPESAAHKVSTLKYT